MTLIGQPVDAGAAEPDTDFAGIAGTYLTNLQTLIRDCRLCSRYSWFQARL